MIQFTIFFNRVAGASILFLSDAPQLPADREWESTHQP